MNKKVEDIINYRKIIKYIMCYFIFTILLFDFGPLQYKTENNILLHFYVLTYFLSFYMGYKFYSKKITYNEDKASQIKKDNSKKIEKILKKGIYINLILIIIFCLITTDTRSIQELFTKLVSALKNPAISYYDKVNNVNIENSISILKVAFMFGYPYILLILVLSVYNFNKLDMPRKIITILTIILEISRWIAMGTNKGVFDILILFISLYLINLCYKHNKKIKKKYKILIVISGILIFFMFTYFISSRMYENNNSMTLSGKIYYGVEKFSNYLVQGYQGMNYALNLEWKPMFGIGNSGFLTSMVSRILNTDLSQLTYAKRAEIYGWSATVNWHTAYTWFANDIHFTGIIVLMFAAGAFLACLIKDIVIYNNYYSMVLFYMMMIGIFYLSANNQVLAFYNMFIAFYMFLFLRWRKKRGEKDRYG